ncbi:hypothetical protein NQ318_022156 [Aromia moschata]|uniref:Secreted protein n=1 Tax=Aromia moschata TaxID=1265417 RepID=A0AAV8Z5Y6_9CUCU|nr:hypothetical protein NQ318_022156 [Aromia moschata]
MWMLSVFTNAALGQAQAEPQVVTTLLTVLTSKHYLHDNSSCLYLVLRSKKTPTTIKANERFGHGGETSIHDLATRYQCDVARCILSQIK